MATIVLSAAGTALGGALGGSVLGMSTAVVGRALGAAVGQAVDRRLLAQGSDAVETGRIDRLHVTAAGEGAPLARIWGRMRVAGQVIWTSPFTETSSTRHIGGGKGAPRTQVTDYSYRVSVALALALCRGQVRRIGRIWADGVEIARDDLGLTLHDGSEDQWPDPHIEAYVGAGATPAYRGIAYVVLADLDLGRFGNRLPQFTFEVMRAADNANDMGDLVRAVALIPGTGDYALSTTPAWRNPSFGAHEPQNMATVQGKTDLVVALDDLTEELPACQSVSLVVSWFGDDLRCGACQVRPRAEHTGAQAEATGHIWEVSGAVRAEAGAVPYVDGAPIYGGTPSDRSVVEAIGALKARGQKVMFYPFLLMEQLANNSLPNPYTGANGQPALPWRGRITTALAPDQAGTTDGTALATAEVAHFFGTAAVGDFTRGALGVSYHGPAEWSFRRMILHYAHLCAVAGGVDAFCIGSEMRGLTSIRDNNGFPTVTALIALAEDVRSILPHTKITYAADWSEYHGMQPAGTSDKIFHLDPLWAHEAIDMVGIDNYMPLSDWRDGDDHADAEWGEIHNLDYLKANVAGGEYYDWYYRSTEAQMAQNRTPITDGHGEPWVWRAKDIRGWWANTHHNRIGGVRVFAPTAWLPEMKPFWFTELGCAAIDKGTNEPNRFLDPKSSESGLPRASNGARDDLIQLQYLRAMNAHYRDPANNPRSRVYGKPMVDMDNAHVWAWDARPYPSFPNRSDLWSDAANYTAGHWLNGRALGQSLDRVIAEICAEAGIPDIDTSACHALVRGYRSDDGQSARAVLQPLLMAYGIDVAERDGVLRFFNRRGKVDHMIPASDIARDEDQDAGPVHLRASTAETVGQLRLTAITAEGDYTPRTSHARMGDDAVPVVTDIELPLLMTGAEVNIAAMRLLANARAGRDRLHLALPRRQHKLGAGDVIAVEGTNGLWRVDRIEDRLTRGVEATRIATGAMLPAKGADELMQPVLPPAAGPVDMLFLDLPPLFGRSEPAPFIVPHARPWPPSVALYAGATASDLNLVDLLRKPALMGVTKTALRAGPVGRWQRGAGLEVELSRGSLTSRPMQDVLAGNNIAALGVLQPDNTTRWEIIQFQDATLIGDRTFRLDGLLRGQAGSEGMMPDTWPAGTGFVLLDSLMPRLALGADELRLPKHLSWGPAQRPMTDPAYRHQTLAFAGETARPFAPCHFRKRALGGDLHLSWIRRTRIGGDTWDGLDVPLSELREAYALRILIDGQEVRRVEVTAPRFIYTAAMQAHDWSLVDGATAGVTDRRVEIAQLSDSYGAGTALHAGL